VSDIDYSQADCSGHSHPNYKDFVGVWPYEVIHHSTDGIYQGSHYFLLRKKSCDGSRYGLIDISFGSCTHCDFLRSVFGFDRGDWREPDKIEQVEEYFERKRKQIQWKAKQELVDFIEDPPDAWQWRRMPKDDLVEALQEVQS